MTKQSAPRESVALSSDDVASDPPACAPPGGGAPARARIAPITYTRASPAGSQERAATRVEARAVSRTQRRPGSQQQRDSGRLGPHASGQRCARVLRRRGLALPRPHAVVPAQSRRRIIAACSACIPGQIPPRAARARGSRADGEIGLAAAPRARAGGEARSADASSSASRGRATDAASPYRWLRPELSTSSFSPRCRGRIRRHIASVTPSPLPLAIVPVASTFDVPTPRAAQSPMRALDVAFRWATLCSAPAWALHDTTRTPPPGATANAKSRRASSSTAFPSRP